MGAERQAADVQPPRRGQVKAITVSATAYQYDITGLPLAGQTPDANGRRKQQVYLTIQAESADVYFYFHSTSVTPDLDETAAVAAGSAALTSYAVTHGARIPADHSIEVRIDRTQDKFLTLKGSGAGTCRFWVSSGPGSP